MDTFVQLALMAKAKAVFETTDTFLSFPALAPLSYPPDALRFSSTTAPTPQQLRTMSEFSRIANSLPAGVLFQPTPDHMLWDEYNTVLQSAIVASGDLSADQKSALAAAEAVLHTTTPDGLRTDSPIVVAYKQCRDAWLKAVQDYNAQKLTAQAATDPARQAQWTNTDEPLLRATIDAATADWTTRGNKAEVEAAQKQEATAAAQSPRMRWQSWVSQFVPDIDVQTDPDNLHFALTAFTPADVVDHDDWPSFTLSAPEIAKLVTTAPKELVSIFEGQSGEPSIDSLSFEYRSVAITRPWFHPDVFSARFWKLPPGSNPVCDGANPPGGDWPAYVTAVVFARNIVVHPRAATGPTAPVPLRGFTPITQRLQFVERFDPATKRMTFVPVPMAVPVAVRAAPPALPSRPPMPLMFRPPMPAIPVPPTAPTGGRPAIAAAALIRLNPALLATAHAAPPPALHPVFVSPPPAFARPPTPPAPPPTPAPAPPPAPTLAPGANPKPAAPDISILAFICKRVPLAPNPDPSLDWGG